VQTRAANRKRLIQFKKCPEAIRSQRTERDDIGSINGSEMERSVMDYSNA